MHILMLTPALPYPAHQGGALRNYGLIYGLQKAGHEITLLSFASEPNASIPKPLSDLCRRVVTVTMPTRSSSRRLLDLALSSEPDLALRLASAAYRQNLVTILQSQPFDLIQFEGLEMAGYLPIVRQHQPQARLCYDAHNAEYRLQHVIYTVDRRIPSRWPSAAYSLIQARRIARFERAICQQVDCVLAVSEEDAAALRPFRHSSDVAVIPNGIFTESYDGHHERLDLGPHVLTFTGKMDYRPNVDAMLWFTAEILPLVHEQVPDARLYIVGQKPHPQLESLRDNDHIALTGWVNDVTPFLHATDVYIAPLRMGSGTRLKILEAMAAGCAIVTTSLGAAGLPAEARQTMRIADSAQEIAKQIIALLNDPQQRDALGQAACRLVKTDYDWTALIPRLLAAYRELGLG